MPNWRGRNRMTNCPTSSFHPSLCPTALPSPPPAPPLPHPADSMKNTRDYKAKHRRRHNEGRDKNLRLFVSPAAAQKAGRVSKRQKRKFVCLRREKKGNLTFGNTRVMSQTGAVWIEVVCMKQTPVLSFTPRVMIMFCINNVPLQ